MFRFLLFLCLLIGCKTTPEPSETKAVIGKDDRISLDEYLMRGDLKKKFISSVGLLRLEGKKCTAFLSGGLLYTSTHCINVKKDKIFDFVFETSDFHFSSALPLKAKLSGDPKTADGVARLRVTRDILPKEDLKLNKGPLVNGKQSFLIGTLPGDFELTRSPKCNLRAAKVSPFYLHDCDTVGGYSGSPIINKNNEVIAIHLGYSKKLNANIAIPLTAEAVDLSKIDKDLIREYDCGPGCNEQCRGNFSYVFCINACTTFKNTSCGDHRNETMGDAFNSACGEVGRGALIAAKEEMSRRNSQIAANRRTSAWPSALFKEQMRSCYGTLVDRVQFFFDAWILDDIYIRPYGRISYPSAAQTFGYSIYFNEKLSQLKSNLQSYMNLMAHELKHTAQYERWGRSMSNFGYHYARGWCEAGKNYEYNKYELEATLIENSWNQKCSGAIVVDRERETGSETIDNRRPVMEGQWESSKGTKSTWKSVNGFCAVNNSTENYTYETTYSGGITDSGKVTLNCKTGRLTGESINGNVAYGKKYSSASHEWFDVPFGFLKLNMKFTKI